MDKYHTPLLADNFYHVFNRAVGSEKLFITSGNYYCFLQKMKRHILPVADVFAYSLLPNHFHLFIRIKPHEALEAHFEDIKRYPFDYQRHDMPDFLMERFSNWLNGYTKYFNHLYDRKGSLFIDYTKRIEAQTDSDITNIILYIHQNAVHHGLCAEIGEWPFDSYNTLLNGGITSLMREEIIQWFGSKERFKEFHRQPITIRTYKIITDFIG